MSAGSTSDMAKTPETPAPASAGHSQRQGSASGNTSNPSTPTRTSEAATQARRPAAMDPIRPARKEQDRRQRRGVEDGEQAGGRGGASPRLAVDGGEPGDQEVVDDPLGGEERRADPGLGIPPGRPCARRRDSGGARLAAVAGSAAPGTHHDRPGNERNACQDAPERQRQAPGGGLADSVQNRSSKRRGDDRAADQTRGVDPGRHTEAKRKPRAHQPRQ